MVKDSNVVTPSNKRYLALGDSYTIGESVLENERYPRQLQDSLFLSNIRITDLNIIARTGWTTANLLDALQSTPPTGTYDMVTLLIGVNNQYQGLSLSQYSIEFTNLLEKSKQYAGNDKNKVVVISIPDYSVVPFAKYSDTVRIRTQLEAFNKLNKDITTQYGIKYVDIFALSQEARYNKTLVARDSLHFSGLEYAKWTRLLLPLAKEILK
ncbi:MAG: SGNH/GDSL hydrolase family protein [Sphingobacteriales bacterium]|nr:SGNH/GDSL hydrolase family protein [Sphingobacteriales bacterium]